MMHHEEAVVEREFPLSFTHTHSKRESLYSYQSVGHDDHTLLFVLCYESISVFHVNAYESLIGDQYKHGGGKIQTTHVKKKCMANWHFQGGHALWCENHATDAMHELE